MRHLYASRASLRLCSLRFCSLRPLPRPPLHNQHDDSNLSPAISPFSTSSSRCRIVKNSSKRHVKPRLHVPVEKQQACEPVKAQGTETQGPETQGPETQGPETQGPETQGPKIQGPQTISAEDGSVKRKKGSSPKAETDHVVKSSGEGKLEFSEENLRLSLATQLPTRQELSELSGGTFARDYMRRIILGLVEALGGEVSIQQSREALPNKGRPFYRTVMTIHFPTDNVLTATGDSFSSHGSTHAAALHALVKMRARGLLTPFGLPTRPAYPDEKDGLLDVYNYAARYRCIPSIIVQPSEDFFSITIDMPEHGINVAIKNLAPITYAEAAAAHEFKKQAEIYHLSKGNDNVVVRDRHALSTRNAKDFFTFCLDSGETLGKPSVVTKDQGKIYVGSPQFRELGSDPRVELEVRTGSRAHTEQAATLVAALSVIKLKPHLFDGFSKALRKGNGKYLAKLSPKDMVLGPELIEELNAIPTVDQSQKSEPRRNQDSRPTGAATPELRLKHALTPEQLATKSSKLQEQMNDYRTRGDLETLRQARSELPMAQYSSQVRQIVHDNVYCVIIGATGSGKTTQVPQILLDEAIENGNGASCNVVCTQPRRIAATSVARRVAGERAEQLQDTVGYHVRREPRPPNPGGSILYCTTGILLQRLLHAPEDVFDHVSHLVIDEVHERDMITDFLFITLKNAMAARAAQGKKLPRVVLMSATIDAGPFAAYFSNSLPSEKPNNCPTLRVPGRTFPVQEHYLDDVLRRMKDKHGLGKLGLLHTDKHTTQYLRAEITDNDDRLPDTGTSTESVIDWGEQAATLGDENSGYTDSVDDALVPLGLAATTVAHIAKTSESGAILVFLPGMDEIVKMDKLLRVERPLGVNFGDARRFQIIMLHSSMQQSQGTVFDQVPEGCRKVILSTNIAETSVTIPDVRFVVDTGKSREKRYDQKRRITQLQTTWISKSNAKQRAGRAGRVQDGVYYALYTQSRRESMRAVALPELLRSDLQEICLDIKMQDFKVPVADFLAGAMEPPSPSAVDIALQNLVSLGAMTEEEDLTPLGRVLASLPIHPTLGKMILLGIIFKCLEPMIILGAAAHDRPLFMNPLHLQQRRKVDRIKKKFARGSSSDHMMILKAFSECRRQSHGPQSQATSKFFWDNFISKLAFQSIDMTAHDIVNILAEAGLIERQHTSDPHLLKYGGRELNANSNSEALIRALLLSGLYPNLAVHTKDSFFRTYSERDAKIHPGSVNFGTKQVARLHAFNSLSLSSDGSSTYMRDTSSVTPLMALLFGGPLVAQQQQQHDDWDSSSSSSSPVLEMDGWLPMSVRAPNAPPGLSLGDTTLDTLLADKVMNLRRMLDGVLASAFDDLASHAPLSEDPARAQLAFRLARVFDVDDSRLVSVKKPGEKVIRSKRKKKKKKGEAGKSAGEAGPQASPPRIARGRTRAKQAKVSQAEVPPQARAPQAKAPQTTALQNRTPRKNTPPRKTPRNMVTQSKVTTQSRPPRSRPQESKAWARFEEWGRAAYEEAK